MRTTRTAASHCPGCGAVRDATSILMGDAVPSEGDLSVCMYCGLIFQFGRGLEQIPMSETEITALPAFTRRNLARAVGTIAAYWRSRGHADGRGRSSVVKAKD